MIKLTILTTKEFNKQDLIGESIDIGNDTAVFNHKQDKSSVIKLWIGNDLKSWPGGQNKILEIVTWYTELTNNAADILHKLYHPKESEVLIRKNPKVVEIKNRLNSLKQKVFVEPIKDIGVVKDEDGNIDFVFTTQAFITLSNLSKIDLELLEQSRINQIYGHNSRASCTRKC